MVHPHCSFAECGKNLIEDMVAQQQIQFPFFAFGGGQGFKLQEFEILALLAKKITTLLTVEFLNANRIT
jgi:hypothetical protein